MPPLNNAKHEAFARAIVEGKGNREAYRAAGYKGNNAAVDASASRLLSDAKVSARVAELKSAAAEGAVMTARQILEQLTRLASANMLDFMRVGPDGDPVLDFSKLTRDQAAALVQVDVEDFKDVRSEDARDVRKVRFKLADKLGALELLGKTLGMYIDRKEVGEPGEFERLSDTELDMTLREEAARLGIASRKTR